MGLIIDLTKTSFLSLFFTLIKLILNGTNHRFNKNIISVSLFYFTIIFKLGVILKLGVVYV